MNTLARKNPGHSVGKPLLTAAALLLTAIAGQAQPISSGHLNVGAISTNAGAQLTFANGAAFVLSSGYVPMILASTGTYAGFYGSGPSFTALAQTLANGGPIANAPSLGSFIQVRMTLESAPLGGAFAFWDEGATSPTFSLSTANATTPMWALSGGANNPTAGDVGADPFGHIHGRRYTATAPGEYVVGFQAFDTSLNGAQHAPSSLLEVRFQAVPEPSSLALMVLAGAASLLIMRRPRRSS